jgi:Ni/Co efflux regulator RcnB
MRKIPMIVLAAAAFVSADAALAQTPAVGDAPAAATVGQDAAIARHREINRERGVTTGFAVHRSMRSDRMPERVAPDAEEAAPAGH